MRAIVTVVGGDRVGIIAGVSRLMADLNINIEDISQTIMKNWFTMIMLVDLSESTKDIEEVKLDLDTFGKSMKLTINLHHKDVFEAMHRI